MSKSIRISENHGVNPCMMLCYLCGEGKGIALMGRLPKDAEAPRSAVLDYEPCDKCKGYMEQGVILIQVADNDRDYRLGGFVVISVEAATRIFENEEVLEKRVAFIGDSLWKKMFSQEE
jgi:hypothetical protein